MGNLKDKTPHKTPGLKTPGLKTPGPKSPGHLAPEPKTPGGLKSPSKSMVGASPAKSIKSPMKSSAATPSRAMKTPGDEIDESVPGNPFSAAPTPAKTPAKSREVSNTEENDDPPEEPTEE